MTLNKVVGELCELLKLYEMLNLTFSPPSSSRPDQVHTEVKAHMICTL